MIRDYNIAMDAQINPSKIAGGLGVMGPHRVHYVYKSTDSYIKSYLQQHVNDANLHTSILDAVDVATNHDTIAVYPGQYIEAKGTGRSNSIRTTVFFCAHIATKRHHTLPMWIKRRLMVKLLDSLKTRSGAKRY